jgi:hypothetical protein
VKKLSLRNDQAENRAAAAAYHLERMQKHREQARAIAVATDLERLDTLRRYLIFRTKTGSQRASCSTPSTTMSRS